MEYLVVFIGGGMGAVTRYLLGSAIQRATGPDFPWGTLAVNMIGCLLVGVAAELIRLHVDWHGNVRLFLIVGILGGFTTFSSFGYETMALIQAGKYLPAFANAVGQSLFGILFVALGFYVTHHFTTS